MDGLGRHRTFRRFSVSFAHSLEESRLVAPVVNQHRLLDGFEDGKEFPPNLPLVLDGVRPQAVLDGGFAIADAQADEVVEIAVGQALDIQIDGRAFDLQFRAANDVDLLLPNRQSLQRVVILLPFVPQPFGPAAGPERIGELRDGEDALAAEFLALLLRSCRPAG